MRYVLPQQIRHDYAGFEALTRLHAQAKDYILEEIEIDMGTTTWLDADMCAVFGAILYSLGDNLNTVNLVNIQPDVERILSKNGFLTHVTQSGDRGELDSTDTRPRKPVSGQKGTSES